MLLAGLALSHSGGKHWDAIFGLPPVAQGETLFKSESIKEVRHVTLRNTNGVVAEFKFIDDRWQALSPWKDRADPEFLRFLISFTSQLTVEESLSRKALSLEEFGLSKGSIEVTMKNAQGDTLCGYLIGRPSALHAQVQQDKELINVPSLFIRQTDKKKKNNIYICSNPTAESIHALFKNDFERFRDHHPFYFTPRLLDQLRIQSQQGEVVLSSEKAQSGWHITKPLNLRTEREDLGTLFSNLAKINAYKIEDRANITLPTTAENHPQAREFSMRFTGEEDPITLKTYPPEAGSPYALATVSNRPEIVFHIPISEPDITSLSDIEYGVNDLRAKTLVQINGQQLSTIILRPKNQPDIYLKRQPKAEWQISNGKEFQAINHQTLSELIYATTKDKIQRFVTDAATDLSLYGLDDPAIQIGFIGYNGSGTRLNIGRDPKGETNYAHIAGSPHIWEISVETLGKIATHGWQWRTPVVWHIPKVDIHKIVVQKAKQPSLELDYHFFSEKWQATRDEKDVTAAINPNRANTFLSHLESISTPSWIGPYHKQAIELLKTPALTIHTHITPVDEEGEPLPDIIKTISIASSANGLLHFGKVTTSPITRKNSIEDANYFLLQASDVKKLDVDLFK